MSEQPPSIPTPVVPSESPVVDLRAARARLADLKRLRDNLAAGRNVAALAELDTLIRDAQGEVDALREQVRQSGDIGLAGDA